MQEYYRLLGEPPYFLNKYLELDIIKRLKGISLLCGMDYASKSAYSFREYISRYDHSLDVALITWNLTHDKNATLAGLFHDVSTPIFSHVVDYMNGDFVNQESTEELTEYIMRNDKKLNSLLEQDGILIDDIVDFKKYSVVDLDRPKMCADRLDNIILVSYNWTKGLSKRNVKKIMDSIYLEVNEDGEHEIAFNNGDIAAYVKMLNDQINIFTHSKKDKYMMLLAANILKTCIDLNLITYDDLFKLTEIEFIKIIEKSENVEVRAMWDIFENVKRFPEIEFPEVKNKNLSPLVKNKRI